MERQIDFFRERHTLCRVCGHGWVVDLGWLDRWEQAEETCPGCEVTCEHEDSPRVTADPDDPALEDDQVAQFSWYHTSTHSDWPTRVFDPAAELTARTRTMMGGDARVAAWAKRQRSKALHVGTYEAAVQNMLRRIRNQADQGSQFYLYRVRLKRAVVVREGWLIDPSNFVGDVVLELVCPPGVDVARYLNYHEDSGGLSLAVGREAIQSVQQIAVPLSGTCDDDWVRDAVAVLDDASESEPAAPATGSLARFVPSVPQRVLAARDLATAVADRLPSHLRLQFMSAAAFADGTNPLQWASGTTSLLALIEDPYRVLVELDGQVKRKV